MYRVYCTYWPIRRLLIPGTRYGIPVPGFDIYQHVFNLWRKYSRLGFCDVAIVPNGESGVLISLFTARKAALWSAISHRHPARLTSVLQLPWLSNY